MNRVKGFAEDLEAISTNVEHEVGRYVKMLRHEATAVRPSESAEVTSTEPLQESNAGDAIAIETASAPKNESHVRTRPKLRQKVSLAEQVILENVTTRLHRSTNELLTEAALRQKLKKLEPDTRQDIVEEALRDWLRKHGYAG